MKQYKVGVLTLSDKGAKGEREDKSGPIICELMQKNGYEVIKQRILPDDKEEIEIVLREWSEHTNLILTTGGTGLSPRDCTPEATIAVATRLVPGIAEAIRAYSMQITPRAMLSRAASVICDNALIINLPGSPKAVEESLNYILPQLEHALDILCENDGECAR